MDSKLVIKLIAAYPAADGRTAANVTVDVAWTGGPLRFYSLPMRRDAAGCPYIMIPGRVRVGANGQPARHDDGTLQYRRIVSLSSTDMRAFSDAVIAKALAEHPDLLGQ